ncbi:glycosyltransferase family 4 protein [Kitasatospora sp. NPDC088556]|uniref:glycosyltransferase family 4 protein n=1 Tax=Kitasatospora sp. NPDC088556 TaxID=3364076 RepID=UPI00382A1B9A
MLHSMLRALVARGHEVQVWLTRYGHAQDPYELDGVNVVPLSARLDGASAIRTADVVVSHLEGVPSTAALARGFGRPLVVVCHNTFEQTFRDIAAGGTTLAVYNSQWMAAEAGLYFAERPEAPQPQSLVVRPPVFADDYRTKPGKAVTLINCCPEKGGLLFADLAQRMPDTPFLAVKGAYGEQIIPDLPNVEVLEHMDGHAMREQVYARTRVLLMPSGYESWGRVGVEALASGIPVIAHPTPGLSESLGAAGLFANRSEPDAWEAILRRLESPAEYRLSSKNAKARSTELDPQGDLAAWCEHVEALAA